MQCTSYHNFLHKKILYLHALQGNGEMGARYLDPKYSRWISVDPALGEYMRGSDAGCGGAYNSVNLSLYHYGGNNPIKIIDLWGLFDYEMKTALDDPDVGPDINFFPVGSSQYNDIKLTDDTPDDYIIAGHGNPKNMSDAQSAEMKAKEVAEIIKSDPLYDSSMTVWLYSCETGDLTKVPEGKTVFAQALANELAVDVNAPSTYLNIFDTGRISISKDEPNFELRDEDGEPTVQYPGDWILFNPEM